VVDGERSEDEGPRDRLRQLRGRRRPIHRRGRSSICHCHLLLYRYSPYKREWRRENDRRPLSKQAAAGSAWCCARCRARHPPAPTVRSQCRVRTKRTKLLRGPGVEWMHGHAVDARPGPGRTLRATGGAAPGRARGG
jgi:hypothetical protein